MRLLVTLVQNFRLPWPLSYYFRQYQKALHFLGMTELIMLINQPKNHEIIWPADVGVSGLWSAFIKCELALKFKSQEILHKN